MATASKLPRVDPDTAEPQSKQPSESEVEECSICMDTLKVDSDIGRLKCVSTTPQSLPLLINLLLHSTILIYYYTLYLMCYSIFNIYNIETRVLL